MGRGSEKEPRHEASPDTPRDEATRDVDEAASLEGARDDAAAGEAGFVEADIEPDDEPNVDAGEEPIELTEVDVLRADIERAEQERASFEEKYKHALADMSNMRRRASEDAVRSRQQAVGRVTQEILPVLDAFDLALASDGDRETLLEGVRMVYAMLEDLLGRNGVTAIQAADCAFDPSVHEAIGTEEREDVEAGTIVAVHQQGYRMQERVLRPARVVVASAKAAATDAAPGDEDASSDAADARDTDESEA